MDNIKFRAMRAAGIGCFVMLAIIGFFVFTTPTDVLIDFLTEVGKMWGAPPTMVFFFPASFPPLTGFICYYFWKWALK